MRFLIIYILLFSLFSSCTYNEISSEPISVCATDKPTFKDSVQPIFKANCVSCHNSVQLYGALSLENYSEISEAVLNGAVIDRISREETDILLMPKSFSKLLEEEIQIIIKWKENGAPNN